MRGNKMRKEYDFSKGVKTPYAKLLKKQITINISTDVLEYFQKMSDETGLPYQTLINFYLMDCVQNKRKLSFK